MSDFVERAIMIANGFEQKAKEVVEDFAKSASSSVEGELTGSEKIQNKIVEESVKALRQVVQVLEEGRGKVEEELQGPLESLMEKFNLATKDEVDDLREMVRVAREKVDELEKRLDSKS